MGQVVPVDEHQIEDQLVGKKDVHEEQCRKVKEDAGAEYPPA